MYGKWTYEQLDEATKKAFRQVERFRLKHEEWTKRANNYLDELNDRSFERNRKK